MSDWDGMNGTRVLTARDVPLGKLRGGSEYGYRGWMLPVTVDIRIEREQRRDTYETVTHEHIREPLSLSMTSAVWRPDMSDHVSGGATREPLRKLAKVYAPGVARQLADIGDRWHLNAMRAACAHMTSDTLVREPDGYGGERIACGSVNTCPVSGYTYGSAWLVEPLPGVMLGTLRALLAQLPDQSGIVWHE
jgi:hypothetical protein